MKYIFQKLRGFSLIEALLVLGAIGLISGLTIPMYYQYAARNDLGIAAAKITQGVARAKDLARSGQDDANWGFSTVHGVLFQGTDYTARDPSFDEHYDIPSRVTVTGTTEVWFEKISGTPNAPGSIVTLTADDGQQRIVNLELDATGTPVNMADAILVCHHVPGQPSQAVFVTDANLPSALAAGDTQGPCPAASSSAGVSSAAAASSSAGGGASSAPLPPSGLFILEGSASSALNVSVNAALTLSAGGTIHVNSTSATAIVVSGHSSLTSPTIFVTGNPGTQVDASAQINGTITSGAAPASDPLAALPVPTPAATTLSAVSASGNASITIAPNTYTSLSVGGNATLTLQPGVYYLTNAITVGGQGNLKGNGVTIYCNGGTITIAGNGSVILSPPSSGTYTNVTLFHNRTLTPRTLTLTGNGNLNISGAIYAPVDNLALGGNGAGNLLGTVIIGKTMVVTGNVSFQMQ